MTTTPATEQAHGPSRGRSSFWIASPVYEPGQGLPGQFWIASPVYEPGRGLPGHFGTAAPFYEPGRAPPGHFWIGPHPPGAALRSLRSLRHLSRSERNPALGVPPFASLTQSRPPAVPASPPPWPP